MSCNGAVEVEDLALTVKARVRWSRSVRPLDPEVIFHKYIKADRLCKVLGLGWSSFGCGGMRPH